MIEPLDSDDFRSALRKLEKQLQKNQDTLKDVRAEIEKLQRSAAVALETCKSKAHASVDGDQTKLDADHHSLKTALQNKIHDSKA